MCGEFLYARALTAFCTTPADGTQQQAEDPVRYLTSDNVVLE
jgi:hypothetical protein